MKKRHQKYVHLSRILRDTVNKYGSNNQMMKSKDSLLGPFYCGMSMIMTIPEYSIKLLSPTSTSLQIAVSVKFSGDKGIIIEFNNIKGDSIKNQSFGCLNLEKQITAITTLDNIITDNNVTTLSGNKYGQIISELIFKRTSTFHPYLYKTFKSFTAHKKDIKIHIGKIDKYVFDKELKELLFYEIVENKDYGDINPWINDNNTDNLTKPILFNIFQNVKEVYINVHHGYYALSLLSLLDILQNTSINKVTINIGWVKKVLLKSLSLCSSFGSIKHQYKSRHFRIKFKFPTDIIISKRSMKR